MNRIIKNKFDYTLGAAESIAYLLISLFIGQLIGGILGLSLKNWGFPGLSIIVSFGVGFGLSLVILFLIKKLSFSVWADMLFTKTKPLWWLISIGIWIAILPFSEYLVGIVPTKGIPILEKLYETFTETFNSLFQTPISAFITVCILAPILEESIFRGFLLQGFLNNKMKPWVAILITSLMFGFAHMNPWQFIGAGFLGACFGFIYWRTGSLLLCIFLHLLNNALSFFALMQTENPETTFFESNNLLIFASIAITISLLYLLKKITPNANIRYTKQ